MVSSYLVRKLGKENDILNAFVGLVGAFTPVLGQFWCGLPESPLGRALSWRVNQGFPVRRRLGFPSWSWAGWFYQIDAKASGNMFSIYTKELHSAVSFYVLNHLSKLSRICSGTE